MNGAAPLAPVLSLAYALHPTGAESNRALHGSNERMLNLLRKFLRPTLREQLEDGVREALRKYAGRHAAPNLRVYVSTDLIPEGLDPGLWARDEGEHLRRFALQWAEDNQVPRAGLRVEVVLLDTKREFAFVKPVALEAPATGPRESRELGSRPVAGSALPRPMVSEVPSKHTGSVARLEVVSSPTLTEPLEFAGELIVGRKEDGGAVRGLGDRYMSARHARFHVAGGQLFVTDLDSKNRTYLNDRPLPPHEPVPTSVGDRIRLGTTTLRVASIGDQG